MVGYLISQLRSRGGRALALASGILVAAVSFVLLTSAATTSQLEVKSTLKKNFRPAYDILVRPRNSFTPLEKKDKLVRANYLSGIFGGISMKQYRQIKKIPGVEVAAPIANLGYILQPAPIPIRINGVLDNAPVQIYRLKGVWKADRGLSTYPENYTSYVYYTRKDRLTPMVKLQDGPVVKESWGRGDPYEVIPGKKNPLPVCTTLQLAESGGSPFGYIPNSPFAHIPPNLTCFSALSPAGSKTYFASLEPQGSVGIVDDFYPPHSPCSHRPQRREQVGGTQQDHYRRPLPRGGCESQGHVQQDGWYQGAYSPRLDEHQDLRG